jgi:glycosyltransferase involved in cell wall biosynthesis
MRIALVIGGIPALGHSGSTIAAWTILEELRSAGHDVTAVLLPAPELLDGAVAQQVDAIGRLGVEVRFVHVPTATAPASRVGYVRSLVAPRDEELFPAARARARVREALADADAFLAFGIEAIAASAGNAGGLAVLSHPPGVSRRIRARYGQSTSLYERSFLLHADRRTAALLRQFDSVGVFSEHHAAWARRHGVGAWYAHYPMPDLAGPDWRAKRAARDTNLQPRVLLIGHLRGIGTISGLHLFVPEILPRLTGFDVRIVGGHEPPAEFREALSHSPVRLLGPIDDPAEEFLRADVLLAPNPTTTGASARILSGLTFGCCIVAHTDSLVGIPELRDDENCLLASDGPGLADATLRALADRDLRDRLGQAGRDLYERAFSPPAAAARLVLELEELAASSER